MRSVLLIAGVDTIGVSRLPALFAAAGFEVDLLGPAKLAAGRSRGVRRHIRCGTGIQETLSCARSFVRQNLHRYEQIVIADEPTFLAALESGLDDEAALAWMKPWCPIPVNPASLSRILSKTQFLIDCRERELLVPEFQVCDWADTLTVADEIGYPVFIKAAKGLSGSGLRYATGRDDLAAQMETFSVGETVVVQRETRGQPGSIGVLYRNGEANCWFAYLMQETWPNRFASACTIQIFSHPDLLPLVTAVGQLTGFNGLSAIDFIYDSRSDRCHLLEFNPRPGPAYYLGSKAGVNFATALKQWGAIDAGVRQDPTIGNGEVLDMFPQAMFQAIDRVRPRQLASSLVDAPWRDTGFVAAHLRRLTTHYVRKLIFRR